MDNLMLIRRAIAPKEYSLSGAMPLSFNARRMPLKSLVREGKCEQRNLPQGYTELEYASNASSTYVNTGITPTTDDVELYIRCTAVTGSFYIMQSRNSSSSSWGLSGSSTGNTITLNVAGTRICQSAISRVQGNIIVIRGTLKSGVATLYVKDETAGTEDTKTGSYTWSNFPTAIGVFGTTTAHYINSGCKCYEAYIKVGGEYVANYTPAKKSSAIGFYDSVSDSHKTATVGSLTAGPDVVPTPTNPVDIWCNNGVLKVKHQSGLPIGYQLLSSITGDGLCCVNTGIILQEGDEIDLDYKFLGNGQSVSADKFFFGTQNSDTSKGGCLVEIYGNNLSSSGSLGTWYVRFSSPASVNMAVPSVDDWEGHIKLKQGEFYVNDNLLLTPSYQGTFQSNPLTLFGRYKADGSEPYCAYLQVSLFTVKNNGQYRYYGVPVRELSTNKLGIYDLVSGSFQENFHTGTFTAGEAVSDPIVVYTDDTPEVLTVLGKNLLNPSIYSQFLQPDGTYRATGDQILASSARYFIPKYLIGKTITYSIFLDLTVAPSPSRIQIYYRRNGASAWGGSVNAGYSGLVSVTFTPATTSDYIGLTYESGGGNYFTFKNVQVELGSTATAYEPYHEQTASVENILSVGDYKDTQEIISGLLTHKVGIKVLDGTETWADNTDNSGKYNIYLSQNVKPSIHTYSDPLCTHFRKSGKGIPYIQMSSKLRFYVDSSITSVTDFTTFLSQQYAAGTPVIVVYPTSGTTTEQVTPQALNSAAGSNTISSTANVQSPQATVKYYK